MTPYDVMLSLSQLNLAQSFPMRLHPQYQEIESVVEAICQSLDIKLPHYSNYQSMPYFMFPDTSVERLMALSLLSNLLYYIDDLYDRHKAQPHPEAALLPARFKRVIKIFAQGQSAMPDEYHRLYDAALALHHQFLLLSNDKWFSDFVFILTSHLMATRPLSQQEDYAGVQDYFCVREHDGGIWTSIKSIEFAGHFFLPDEICAHPHIQHMSVLCGRIATLTNDLFSYEKEVIRMGSNFNLVSVLMQTESLTFEQAVQRSIDSINEDIDQFLMACEMRPDFGSDDLNAKVDQYVQGLHDILSATWHWQMSTDRYRSATSPFVELRLSA